MPMKKRFLKLMTAFLLLGTCFLACKKDDSRTIIGKWKLVNVTTSGFKGGIQSFDYNSYNIVYTFMKNDVLIIRGEIEKINTYKGHEVDEHSYTIVDDKKGYGWNDFSYGLKIDYTTYWYKISSRELEISSAPLDGNIYKLIKLK
jgi:hypothetical protein